MQAGIRTGMLNPYKGHAQVSAVDAKFLHVHVDSIDFSYGPSPVVLDLLTNPDV